MVSLRLLFITTSLFISQGYSQLTLAPLPCGPTTITPTGPIIPVGQFIVPAIIKPLVTPCQPLPPLQPLPPCPPSPPCQPLPPCPPLPPLQPLPPCPPMPPCPPTQFCTPKKPVPGVEDDDDEDEDLDKILYLLINNILENRKNSGKKTGSGKGADFDKSIDSSNIYVDCGDDYEYILPSPYSPYQAPASATFYPYGAGEQAAAGCAGDPGFSLPVGGNGYAPEICLTFRPFMDNCE